MIARGRRKSRTGRLGALRPALPKSSARIAKGEGEFNGGGCFSPI